MKPPKIGNSPFKNKGTIRPMEMYPYHGHPGDGQPHYTGRHFLIHKETKGGKARIKRILESKWGFTVAETLDFKTRGINEQEIEGADALIYNELGITLLGTEDNPIPLLRSLDNEYFIAPEKVVYLLEDQPPSTWGIRTTGADRSL
jgi:hypothetical protein